MKNGVGPWWFPASWRRALTDLSLRYFKEASWDKHDVGYALGRPSRAECDRKFLQAMLRDASETTTTTRVFACVSLSITFWVAVRLFGWASYNRKGVKS